jgi:ribose-phosphate pyrophosphokinase
MKNNYNFDSFDTHTQAKIKIFVGNASPQLGNKISSILNLPIADMFVDKFSDGECNVTTNESVRGCDTFIIQSTSYPVNDNLVELLIMIDALKRASAGRVTVVVPYFGYARQDRKAKPRDPITAKLVADLLTKSGADRIVTMDLHAAQIQGFFDIPVDHLYGIPVLRNYLSHNKFFDNKDVVIVSPDVGSVARCREFASKLGLPIAIVDKRRPRPNVSEVLNIIGDVKYKTCLLFDDMIDTAGTIVNAAKSLVDMGQAKEVYACCTHGVLSGQAILRIKDSPILKLFLLDTIELPQSKQIEKIQQISTDQIFALAIHNIHFDKSISEI